MLPPGRAKLAIIPVATGSVSKSNATMGVVAVTARTASATGVLTAAIRPARGSGDANAAQLACRVEDFGTESQVRVRIDFTPSIERAARRSRLVLVAIWPAWIAVVTCSVLIPLSLAERPGPLWALNLLHAAYPLAAMIALRARYRSVRTLLVRAVGSIVENLRYLPR